MKTTMTPQLARAAATDKANRNMRRHNRSQWSLEDYRIAIREFWRLCPDSSETTHCVNSQLV